MLEIDTSGFIPQNYPDTQSKLNSYVKRLDKVYEFIKEQFILTKTPLKHTTKKLYELYAEFCNVNSYKKLDKPSFAEKLKQVNINWKKTSGNNYYKYSIDELTEIATKLKWLHELDDVVNSNNNNDDEEEEQYEKIIEEKNIEIQRLLDIIEQMKKQNITIEIVKNESEPEEDLFASL